MGVLDRITATSRGKDITDLPVPNRFAAAATTRSSDRRAMVRMTGR